MIKECPNCKSTDITKATDSNLKMSLLSYQATGDKVGVHMDTVMPVDVWICKNCGFVSSFIDPVLSQKATLDNQTQNN